MVSDLKLAFLDFINKVLTVGGHYLSDSGMSHAVVVTHFNPTEGGC